MSTNENHRGTLISIDPGYSTGVAVFVSGHLVDAFTSTTPHMRLRALLSKECEVVCEAAPLGRNDWAQGEVEELVRENKRASWYRPSEWKPHPSSRTSPREGNRHERDAIGIGRYHLAVAR